jgi:hypothetical protein
MRGCLGAVVMTKKAIETFVFCQCLSYAILTGLGLTQSNGIWGRFTGWLRIVRTKYPSIWVTKQMDREEYIEKLRRFYNGYRFSKKDLTEYNPFGLLNHFYNNGDLETYWFATGTPTFLIKLMEAQNIDILDIEKKKISAAGFQKFDVENMDALGVLYQSGYLTITGYSGFDIYTLDYPNEEVKTAFAESLLHHLSGI